MVHCKCLACRTAIGRPIPEKRGEQEEGGEVEKCGGRGAECSERRRLVKKGTESVWSWLCCKLFALVVTLLVTPCCVESGWLFWPFEKGTSRRTMRSRSDDGAIHPPVPRSLLISPYKHLFHSQRRPLERRAPRGPGIHDGTPLCQMPPPGSAIVA